MEPPFLALRKKQTAYLVKRHNVYHTKQWSVHINVSSTKTVLEKVGYTEDWWEKITRKGGREDVF